MQKEIGSEFWLTEMPTKENTDIPDWINAFGNNILTSSGRGAITLILNYVEDTVISKTVLLPAYICDSVIIPFINNGYTCYFYDIDYYLKPDMESLCSFLEKDIGIFFYIGYFGFQTYDNIHEYINLLNQKGTIIIEDITHTLFSKYERYSENDYYIASLRKWTGLPSGGLLVSKKQFKNVYLDTNEDFSNIRRQAMLIKKNYIDTNNNELKQTYLQLFNKAEYILDNDMGPYNMDKLSKSLICELNVNELIEKRRGNFAFLLETLNLIDGINPVFNTLFDNICPLFFPIYVNKERNHLRKFLIDKKIYCPIHWPEPLHIDIKMYPSSQGIYNSILSIPCDQRYELNDMNYIATNFKNYYM